MRRNRIQAELAETFGVSQPTVSRAVSAGVEFLHVAKATEVAGIRLLPLDDPEIPRTIPLFRADQSIASFAAVPVTGTNTVFMAARARKLAGHALRVLRIALRQTNHGLNPQQLRFRLGTSHAFREGAGGWQRHDEAFSLELPSYMAATLAAPAARLPPTATKKSIQRESAAGRGVAGPRRVHLRPAGGDPVSVLRPRGAPRRHL